MMECIKCERYHKVALSDVFKCSCLCHKVLNGGGKSDTAW